MHVFCNSILNVGSVSYMCMINNYSNVSYLSINVVHSPCDVMIPGSYNSQTELEAIINLLVVVEFGRCTAWISTARDNLTNLIYSFNA